LDKARGKRWVEAQRVDQGYNKRHGRSHRRSHGIGKSTLALAVARRLGGVVINADAMQVYADLRVLTARPSPTDEAVIPHALYGTVDAAISYSVAAWLSDAQDAIEAAHAAGRRPVLVGGTGLYLTALTEGLSQVPPIPPAVRTKWRTRQGKQSSEMLHAELAARDALMAGRLRPSDAQRIVRALEVIEGTGRSLAHWQADRVPGPLAGAALTRILITPERSRLRQTIAERFAVMVARGAVEEAATLIARGLEPALPAMKAIGLRQLGEFAAGRLSLPHAMEAAITLTRQYAKRQETWFRHRFADWPRVSNAADGLDLIDRDAAQLRR
ncbi:MAG: tRNA (adenosine(37)-N6)-dimethylallyltransferase MiaA, partial [Pseudomonadota bacterium]